ncbi:hypothetical protein D5F01_LYC22364 [Xyrichtys novacula]|uniref:Uncharacterized protein n=1 Tax=Xyrichtys novacula TaxID=13765 RepID=A0AAV1EQ26_XYRNO|nr:hypothetical protein D5F01_LYC22364 [Xyrichtys novacula]
MVCVCAPRPPAALCMCMSVCAQLCASEAFASDFLDLLDTLNLTQHVHSPTHSHGHTLDLVCSTGISIHHLSTTNLYISDHLAVTFNVDPPPLPHSEKRQITFRNLKSISPQDLSASLSATLTASPPTPSAKLPDLLNYYNNTLSSCLDQLAPLKTKTVSFRHSAPWYTSELHKMKSHKRQLERLYRKTGFTVHLQAYTDHLHLYRTALKSARSSYYSNLINSGSSNQKALFSTVKKLLHPIDSTSITFTPEKCNTFLSSFQTKINAIYNSLPPPSIPCSSPPPLIPSALSCFSPVSSTDEPGREDSIISTPPPPLSPLPQTSTLVQAIAPHSTPEKVVKLFFPDYVVHTDTELEHARKEYFELAKKGEEQNCQMSKDLRCRLIRNTMTSMIAILRAKGDAESDRYPSKPEVKAMAKRIVQYYPMLQDLGKKNTWATVYGQLFQRLQNVRSPQKTFPDGRPSKKRHLKQKMPHPEQTIDTDEMESTPSSDSTIILDPSSEENTATDSAIEERGGL